MPDTALSLTTPHHPLTVFLTAQTPATRKAYRAALDRIAAMVSQGQCDAASFEWAALRYPHTTAIRSLLAERFSPATANQHLAALRGILRVVKRLGLMSAQDYADAVDLKNVKGEAVPPGRMLTDDEVGKMLDVCVGNGDKTGARDAAMIAVLRAGGLRREELCKLSISDYEHASGALTVHGKGNKVRLVYIHNGAAEALADWLTVRGEAPSPLFCRVYRGEWVHRDEGLSVSAIQGIVQRRAHEAGVEQVSTHDFRRTFISDLLDTADIATVARMVGHSHISTTARYDRRGERAKDEVARGIQVPYKRNVAPSNGDTIDSGNQP